MAERLKRIAEHPWFQRGIIGLIVLAAVLVGVETYPAMMDRYGPLLKMLDRVILIAFTVEALIKMGQHGAKWHRYFHDPWNVFDFLIVAVCWLPVGGQYAAVLRLARILRTLRLISTVPRLQLLVGSLIRTIPSMGYVGLLLLLLFYVYAVIGVMLWGTNDPGHFGDLPRALLTLFRVVTLEDWTDVMYTQMFGSAAFPPEVGQPPDDPELSVGRPILAAVYFVSFVLIGTMIVLNLFIGVIVNSMDEAQAEIRDGRERPRDDRSPAPEADASTLIDELETMEQQLEQVRQRLRSLRQQAAQGRMQAGGSADPNASGLDAEASRGLD